MARAAIIFDDTEDGVEMQLHFEEDLPEDPAEATDAQMSALIAFQSYLASSYEGEEVSLDMPDDEVLQEEASQEV